ncbi:transcription antitermination factor NusB [Mycoplasmopsis columbinasalis]|uniref:Transcription termination factor n=1 Tax=Mycoplasmopsis columbinasalis TaxID=114880 RepID=A0A449B9X2_9BACT|nr:transcription antitermination factor NusB [Mycoplasmopsis columbinasalis]VEU77981.1 transcription termination factor [Mycoplasmopsis columbinasalis]
MEKKLSQHQKRIQRINVLYRYELMNSPINLQEIFEDDFILLSNEQFKKIEAIQKNYDYYKKVISRFFNSGWIWERIEPFVRGILLNAVNEFLLGLDPKIVVNEAINVAKKFCAENIHKWINAILQSIYKYFVLAEVVMQKEGVINDSESAQRTNSNQ